GAPEVPGADGDAPAAAYAEPLPGYAAGDAEHGPAADGSPAPDGARPQPDAARKGRGRRAGLPGLHGQVGPVLPGRRERRPAHRADAAPGGPDAVAARQHEPGAAPPARRPHAVDHEGPGAAAGAQ